MNKYYLKNLLALFLLSMVLTGCKLEPVEPGIETSVAGRVYDGWNDQPIPNFKIKVAEYMNQRAGLAIVPSFIQFIDSTYTAADGSYSMAFRTSGKGNYYRLEHEQADKYGHKPLTTTSDLKAGVANSVHYDLEQTLTLKARVVVHDNPNPPLKMALALGSNYQSYLYIPEISGANNEAVRYMQLSRNAENKIRFYVHDDPYYTTRRMQEQSVQVGDVELTDTLEQVFDLYPSQFK